MTSAPWTQMGSTPFVKGAPAYTPVPVRRSLTKPEQSAQPAQQPNKTVKLDWPQPVRDYVSRAFMSEKAIPGIEKEAVSAKLKSVITEAAESGRLDLVEWSTYPLPQELIQAERANMYANTLSAASHAGTFPLATNGSQMSPTSRKRKPSDAETLDTSNKPLPPWRQKANQATNALADRMTYPDKTGDKRQKKADEFRATAPTSKFSDLEKRRQRFDLGNSGSSSPYTASSRDDHAMSDANDGPVVGTCQNLEKSYFRLTAPPKAATVRPLPILKQALDMLIKKWKDEHNYGYICDQFKSLRQDLTVQHIKNEFTVRVYEAHARIALEKGDLGEYNQCQTQLRALYKQKLGGCPGEFTAYRILYFIYTCNRTGMNDVLADLTTADKQIPAIRHALAVRSSLATGNYHKFFRLFNESPNMGGYLMDMFIDRERLAALASICKAYKPDVKVDFLTDELAFNDDQHCAQFLCENGGETLFESRPDGARFLSGKAGQIFEAAKASAFRSVDIKGQI